MSEIEKDTKVEGGKKCPLWPLAIFCFVIGVLVVVGFLESQKSQKEETRLSDELSKVQKELVACQVNKLPKCEVKPNVGFKKAHKKVRRYAAPKKPPVVQARVEEKKFDSWNCGEWAEAVINKATGKPECRMIVAPAPVVTKVEIPKQEMKCEKPLIRELRDDGSIACIALPAPVVAQPTPTPSANGCYTDPQGRIMCPRSREARSSSGSWVPWAIGGAAVLALIANNRHRGDSSPSGPGVVTLPPSSGPGVVTLPPVSGPGVVTY